MTLKIAVNCYHLYYLQMTQQSLAATAVLKKPSSFYLGLQIRNLNTK